MRLANLQAGSLDIVDIVPTDIAAVKKNPALKLAMGDGLAYMGLSFNTDNPPGNSEPVGRNALVRQAFELSIDRKVLIDVVFNGAYTPIAQANTPSSPFYVKEVVPPARDIAKAKALLKQAGVTGRGGVERHHPEQSRSDPDRRGAPGDVGRGRLRAEDPADGIRLLAEDRVLR